MPKNKTQPKDKSIYLFSNVKETRTSAILKSNKDTTFHIWTKPNSFYHTHENYVEIFIVTEGKLTHHFEGESMTMKQGDAFIIFPGQYHKHSPYKNYVSKHINLSFSLPLAELLLKYCTNSSELSMQRQLVHLNANEFKIVSEMQDIILKSPNDPHSESATKSLISFVLGAFAIPEDDEINSEMPKWLEKFISHLQNLDFSKPIDLSELYCTSGYSQTVVSKTFKAYTGQTLISYITDLKLNYARNQLKSTAYSVTEIARLSGFDSYPHFSRVFKKKFNVSPLQFRNTQL